MSNANVTKVMKGMQNKSNSNGDSHDDKGKNKGYNQRKKATTTLIMITTQPFN